jgi:hypothetical protein
MLARLYRHYIWLRQPLDKSYLLDRFLGHAPKSNLVVANGDYSCDCASLGLSNDATLESVAECIRKLRDKFSSNLRLTIGDHELGKASFFGGRGGMRFESWRRTGNLGLAPFWRVDIGNYVIVGITSSVVALPVFELDILQEERQQWEEARARHLEEIRAAFGSLKKHQRVLLFTHDPTALPFLSQDPLINSRVHQIEQTVIGHLHSNLVLWKGRLLAGIPRINFLGQSARRFSAALQQAREWRHFKVRLCPALAGVELLKDGGYLTARLDPEGEQPAIFEFHGLKR